MVKSMFAGVAGLRTHQAKMDVIGNNIANVNTWGYKAASMSFKDAMYQTTATGSGGKTSNGGYGGTNAAKVGYGVTTGSITYDFGKGGMAPSASGLDCYIDGTGFYIVGPMIKDGTVPLDGDNAVKSNGFYLTRVGKFQVDGNGYLTDDSGNYVYGYKNTQTGAGDPTFDTTNLTALKIPKKSEIGETGDEVASLNTYKIQTDGTVTGTSSVSGKTVTIGKIALAGVQNTGGLEKDSGYYYTIGANAGNVSAYEGGGTQGRIIGNFLEQAKVDLATEMTEMITAQRGFQANSKIITVTDQMLEELVNLKR